MCSFSTLDTQLSVSIQLKQSGKENETQKPANEERHLKLKSSKPGVFCLLSFPLLLLQL